MKSKGGTIMKQGVVVVGRQKANLSRVTDL